MTKQGRVPFRRHHVSRRAAELGVHMAIIRGRFVVFVAGTIAARAVAGVLSQRLGAK